MRMLEMASVRGGIEVDYELIVYVLISETAKIKKRQFCMLQLDKKLWVNGASTALLRELWTKGRKLFTN